VSLPDTVDHEILLAKLDHYGIRGMKITGLSHTSQIDPNTL